MTPRENPVNLHHLRVFQTVARYQSFSRAAMEIVLSQPAASKYVKKLEEDFGLPLFAKQGRRVLLTDAGRHLYRYSQQIFTLLEETSQVMEALRAGERGRVRLAVDLMAGAYVAPELLGAFRRLHPRVEILLEVAERPMVIKRLLRLQADLALVEEFPDLPNDPGAWCATPFLPNELVVIAPPEHPLARASSLPLAALKGEPFILGESGSGTHTATERFLAESGVRMRMGMEVGNTGAIKESVANGLGIAIMPRRAMEVEVEAGRVAILNIDGFPLRRYWYLVHGRRRSLPPATEAFRTFLLTGMNPQP